MIPAEARGAWRDIESRLRPYVARRLASAADVDDVVQEILVRVHKGLATLRDDESFGGWVYRIAARAIADAGRSQARDPLGRVAGAPEVDAPGGAPDDAAELQLELGACVALFVARLPSPYREAITLTELEGLSQKEAAEMVGTSLSGMKSRVQRGRERIREMFEACCEISVDCRGRVVDCAARDLEQVPEDCRGAAASWAARHPAGGAPRRGR
jgi:RNA polymerase sigma-70 factor (ECF subfamily)